MKRKNNYTYVKKIWSLILWHRCIKCCFEFRCEYLWQYTSGPYYLNARNGINGVNNYLCTSCAPTIEDAEVIFNELNKLPDKPPFFE